VKPSWAVRFEERRAYEAFRREEALNRFVESRRPGLVPSFVYRKAPFPPSDPRFGAAGAYWTYRQRREMSKYGPNLINKYY
jgi:hypothetical protein